MMRIERAVGAATSAPGMGLDPAAPRGCNGGDPCVHECGMPEMLARAELALRGSSAEAVRSAGPQC